MNGMQKIEVSDKRVQEEMNKFMSGRPSQIGMIVHEPPKERTLTQADADRLEKARLKRERKKAKKLGQTAS